MAGQRGFWDVEERLKELSAEGDPLEKSLRHRKCDDRRPFVASEISASFAVIGPGAVGLRIESKQQWQRSSIADTALLFLTATPTREDAHFSRR